eukprot:2637396-Rhodomonas_salina.1
MCTRFPRPATRCAARGGPSHVGGGPRSREGVHAGKCAGTCTPFPPLFPPPAAAVRRALHTRCTTPRTWFPAPRPRSSTRFPAAQAG